MRDCAKLADAMVVTDTYAVTLDAINGGADGQADVYAISTGGLARKHTLQGNGQPHDIDRSSDGRTELNRTLGSIPDDSPAGRPPPRSADFVARP